MVKPSVSRRESLLSKYGALCWRCGWPIYEGQPWERGHTLAKHLGGKEVRPEHEWCNREDGYKQTKIAAKIKRMQKKGFDGGELQTRRKKQIPSRPFGKPQQGDPKTSKLKWDWKKKD